jgi:nitrite reductase/ring-hydroxylating ferredoxin subunit
MSPLVGLFSSCTSLPVFKTSVVGGKLIVPIDTFLPGENRKIVRSMELDYDVMLVKKTDNDFYSLLMKCTHQDNRVVSGNSMLACNLHGSTFDMEGNVTNGPSTDPLKRLQTETSDNTIVIHIQKS